MLKRDKMKMPKSKKKEFGHKAAATEYCPGYVDMNGIWNNGFYCPKWGSPDQQYCCGDDSKRVCCPAEDTHKQITSRYHQQVPLIIGLAVGSAILLITAFFVTCYFCRCCYVYKRRKRIYQSSCTMAHIPMRQAEASVHYSACPHYYPELLGLPLDDPPPYPGHEQIEKVPLHPTTSSGGGPTDTSGEDSPLHLPRYSQIILLQQAERRAQSEEPAQQQSAVTRIEQQHINCTPSTSNAPRTRSCTCCHRNHANTMHRYPAHSSRQSHT